MICNKKRNEKVSAGNEFGSAEAVANSEQQLWVCLRAALYSVTSFLELPCGWVWYWLTARLVWWSCREIWEFASSARTRQNLKNSSWRDNRVAVMGLSSLRKGGIWLWAAVLRTEHSKLYGPVSLAAITCSFESRQNKSNVCFWEKLKNGMWWS